MKNLLFSVFVLLAGATAANAQFFSIGLKGGVNTQLHKPGDIVVPGDTATTIGVKNFKFGTQFGGYIRLGNKVFIQPELLFNSNKTDFKIGKNSFGEIIKTERYNFLDFPLLVGVSTGPFRLSAGPVGHYYISNASELTDLKGYAAKFKQMEWGWVAGLTIGRGRISADIRYEGNFSKFGDHMTFFGQPYHFATTPSRILLGINIALIK